MSTAEDAGTITSQIRLELTQMQKDGLQAQKMMDSYAQKFKAQGEKGGKMYVQGFGQAQFALNQKLNNMVSSMQGVSPKMGALGAKMASAFSAPIFSMVPAVSMAFTTMLGVIGPIIAVVGVLAAGIKKLVDKHKENVKEMELSKTTSAQLKNVTLDLSEAQNASASALANMANNAAYLNKETGNTIKTHQQWKSELNALNDKIDEVKNAMQDAYDEHMLSGKENIAITQELDKEYNKLMEDYDNLTKEMNDAEKQLKNDREEAKTQIKELNEANKKNHKEYISALTQIKTAEEANSKTARDAAKDRASATEKYRDSLVSALAEAQSLALVNDEAKQKVNELKGAIAALNSELRDMAAAKMEVQLNDIGELLRLGVISEEESLSRRLDLQQQKVMLLYEELQAVEKTYYVREEMRASAVNAAKDRLKYAISEREELEELIRLRGDADKKTDAEKIMEARLAAIERYTQAEEKANDAREAGLIDEIELQKQLEAARAQYYNDLEAIAVQYRNATGEARKQLDITNDLRDSIASGVKSYQDRIEKTKIEEDQQEQLTKLEVDRLKASAKSAKTEEERNKYLDDAIELENAIIQGERDIEKEKLKARIEANDLFSEEDCEIILRRFDEITEGMKKTRDEMEKGSTANLKQTGEAALSAYNDISNAMLETSRQKAEEEMALIDELLEHKLDAIEEERKAALIAAGFAVANNAESLEKQLEDIIRTGDEVLIYQAQRRLEEQRINDKFDEQAKAAADEAAKEKAEIEFKLAKEEYAMKMINAVNAMAMAILQALQSAPPPYNFILAGLSGAAAGVQIGMLAKNPPKPPKFANSGIVPGNKYSGDRVNALVDSGELILNRAHQDNIAGQLTSSGEVQATIILMLDGHELAKNTVNMVNDGFYTIKARAVQ